jgi:hypothetical protein
LKKSNLYQKNQVFIAHPPSLLGEIFFYKDLAFQKNSKVKQYLRHFQELDCFGAMLRAMTVDK